MPASHGPIAWPTASEASVRPAGPAGYWLVGVAIAWIPDGCNCFPDEGPILPGIIDPDAFQPGVADVVCRHGVEAAGTGNEVLHLVQEPGHRRYPVLAVVMAKRRFPVANSGLSGRTWRFLKVVPQAPVFVKGHSGR